MSVPSNGRLHAIEILSLAANVFCCFLSSAASSKLWSASRFSNVNFSCTQGLAILNIGLESFKIRNIGLESYKISLEVTKIIMILVDKGFVEVIGN